MIQKTKNANSVYKYDNEKSKTDNPFNFSFDNQQQQINFIEYCKSKVIRFLLTFTKLRTNVTNNELLVIPWIDFKQKWNDKKLCEFFNIDKQLWNYIDNFIPNYYKDYESGF